MTPLRASLKEDMRSRDAVITPSDDWRIARTVDANEFGDSGPGLPTHSPTSLLGFALPFASGRVSTMCSIFPGRDQVPTHLFESGRNVMSRSNCFNPLTSME